MSNNNQYKDSSDPLFPRWSPKGLVLPWWLGQGTCLTLLGRIFQGQPHTQSEVRGHPGIPLRSRLASFQPLTPTNKHWNKLRDWEKEVTKIKGTCPKNHVGLKLLTNVALCSASGTLESRWAVCCWKELWQSCSAGCCMSPSGGEVLHF